MTTRKKKRIARAAVRAERPKRAKRKQSPATASADAAAHAQSAARATVPRRAGTLVRRIFAKNDPVDVATKLLNGERDATAGRVYLQLLEYLYGKPAQPVDVRGAGDEQEIEYQFVSNIPRPQYPPPHRAPGSLDARESAGAHSGNAVSTPPAVTSRTGTLPASGQAGATPNPGGNT